MGCGSSTPAAAEPEKPPATEDTPAPAPTVEDNGDSAPEPEPEPEPEPQAPTALTAGARKEAFDALLKELSPNVRPRPSPPRRPPPFPAVLLALCAARALRRAPLPT